MTKFLKTALATVGLLVALLGNLIPFAAVALLAYTILPDAVAFNSEPAPDLDSLGVALSFCLFCLLLPVIGAVCAWRTVSTEERRLSADSGNVFLVVFLSAVALMLVVGFSACLAQPLTHLASTATGIDPRVLILPIIFTPGLLAAGLFALVVRWADRIDAEDREAAPAAVYAAWRDGPTPADLAAEKHGIEIHQIEKGEPQ